MGKHLGVELSLQRRLRRILAAAAIALALAAETSSAEGLFDPFFGGSQKQQPQASFFSTKFSTPICNRTPHRNQLPQARVARDLVSACAPATGNIFR